MAIQVVVKSVGEDFSLFGEEARHTKLAGKDVYEVFDANKNLLYCIPVEQIRYMQIVNSAEIPVALDGPKRSAIYLNEKEVFIQADRFEFVSLGLGNPSTNIEIYTLNGEQLVKEFVVPFENLKYIDFNNSPITISSVPANEEVEVVTETNPNEQPEPTNTDKKALVRIKPRS